MSFSSPAIIRVLAIGLVLWKSLVHSDNTKMIASLDGENYYTGDVAMKLKQEHIRVMEEENRLHLLISLKKKGLSTRDVMAFIKNQADSRSVHKGLDKSIASKAMTSKIRDCRAVLFSHRKKRNEFKCIVG